MLYGGSLAAARLVCAQQVCACLQADAGMQQLCAASINKAEACSSK